MDNIEQKLGYLFSLYDDYADSKLGNGNGLIGGKRLLIIASILSSIIGVLAMFREMAGEDNRTLTATLLLFFVVLLLYTIFTNIVFGSPTKSSLSLLLLAIVVYSVVSFFVSMFAFVFCMVYLFAKSLASIKVDGTPNESFGSSVFVANTGRTERLIRDSGGYIDSAGRRYKDDENGETRRVW